MIMQQKLYKIYMEFINENYDIKSLDHLREVIFLESEKIFTFISSKLQKETVHIIPESTVFKTEFQTIPSVKCPSKSSVCVEKEHEIGIRENNNLQVNMDLKKINTKTIHSIESSVTNEKKEDPPEENKKSWKSLKQIKCSQEGCQTRFSSKNALVNHIKKIHQNLKIACMFCQKEYRYSSSLKYHINKLHLKINPYPCIYSKCMKVFPSRNNWLNHIKHCKNSRLPSQIPYI